MTALQHSSNRMRDAFLLDYKKELDQLLDSTHVSLLVDQASMTTDATL